MIKLVGDETYDVSFPECEEKGIPKDKQTVFVLKKLTASEVNQIDDEITISKGEDQFRYLGGTAARMKVRFALVKWRNMDGDTPCIDSNKLKLPSDVQSCLVDRIDKDNKLGRYKGNEKEKK